MVRILALSFFVAWAVPAIAGELVQPGDVLLVSVAEDQRFGRDAAKVAADGQIQLPAVGGIAAAGSDVTTIAARIGEALEKLNIIKTPTVLVEISAYRPFYVGGAVSRPGEIPFEPGLTVRHAIVLAGGLVRDTDAGLTLADVVELRTKWRSNSLERVAVESQIARLEAELKRSESPDFSQIDTRFADKTDATSLMALDTDLLRDRDHEWTADQEHLKAALAMVDFEIETLAKQADLQQQEIDLQGDQVDKSRELREKGLIPLSQLQELERERSRLQRDVLENQAFSARARQTKATAQYDLETADTKWRIEVRSDLRAALLERSRIVAEGEVIAAALANAGVSVADRAPDPMITIHRGQEKVLDATLDTEIRPGDLIEVSIGDATEG
jgi:polysaccharide export outer membrane protein